MTPEGQTQRALSTKTPCAQCPKVVQRRYLKPSLLGWVCGWCHRRMPASVRKETTE